MRSTRARYRVNAIEGPNMQPYGVVYDAAPVTAIDHITIHESDGGRMRCAGSPGGPLATGEGPGAPNVRYRPSSQVESATRRRSKERTK